MVIAVQWMFQWNKTKLKLCQASKQKLLPESLVEEADVLPKQTEGAKVGGCSCLQ